MASAVYEVPPEVLELLSLPPLNEQSEQQLRGYSCVWGREPLTTETAIDLGPRRKKRLGGSYQIFPRACFACTARAARDALREHGPRCEQCTDDASLCSTRRTLEQIAREARR